jgi:predicted dithiol-disulfide oxidoreductase (DUF899 family)
MSLPPVVSRQEWLDARTKLLAEEKELTRARDELVERRRRELGMVRVEKDYVFHGPDGEARLADMFGGHRQLLVQHFMFQPEWEDGCPSCTWATDEVSAGRVAHLAEGDTAFAMISLAPVEKLEAYKAKRGWDYPWYSSGGSDFNRDFQVTVDAGSQPVYNYRTLDEYEARGQGPVGDGEYPGFSVFLREGDDVFHAYSSYARGTETIGGSHYILDMTPLGRAD